MVTPLKQGCQWTRLKLTPLRGVTDCFDLQVLNFVYKRTVHDIEILSPQACLGSQTLPNSNKNT